MISLFYTDSVTVRTKNGEGSMGPIYGATETVPGIQVDETQRLVRAADGREVMSSTTIRGPLPLAGKFVVGSLVTLDSGDVVTVVSWSRMRSAQVLDPVAHFEAACQ